MSPVLIFLGVIAAIAVWWAARHRLASKPWTEVGWVGAAYDGEGPRVPAAKIGLGVFLAVVGALFALLTSAYLMRMNASDWWSLPVPRILWVNTAVLFASSAALHLANVAARRGEDEAMKIALVAGFVTAVAFLVGQLLAWRQLVDAGYLLAGNPANSFFYMITGLHGLHIIGGLVGLTCATRNAYEGAPREKMRLGVELCATYWHFMLFVWLVLLALFTGYASDLVDICRQLLT